jgi:hypothetical protein
MADRKLPKFAQICVVAKDQHGHPSAPSSLSEWADRVIVRLVAMGYAYDKAEIHRAIAANEKAHGLTCAGSKIPNAARSGM